MEPTLEDLRSLAVYARVVEAKSFTAAAARLGLSKSAVSARLAQLEGRLGVRLLRRTTRRMSLTAEGARLYERCAHLLRAAQEAVEVVADVGRRPHGLLRVTAPVGLGLFRLARELPSFAERYPEVRLDLSLSDQAADVIQESFDVAIRVAARLTESTLIARRIGTDRRVACAAPAYLEERGFPRTPHDLAEHNCLRLAGRPDRETWTFFAGPPVAIPVSGNLIVDNVVVMRTALLGGQGIAIMPRAIVDADLEAGRLVEVLEDHPFPERGIYVLHTHGRHAPAKVRAFVEFAVERLGDRGAPPRLAAARPPPTHH